jgi:hypothetical protein
MKSLRVNSSLLRTLGGVLGVGSLALPLLAAACGGEAPSGSAGPATRDSAGIRIVENRGPGWPQGSGWTVADSPSVDIGGAGSGPDYEFNRVVGAVRLPDGRIAVANVGTSEIRFYDAAGSFAARSGRRGAGPGEYQSLAGLWIGRGDSLLAADMMAQRLAVLDSHGGFGRHFSLGGRAGLNLGEGGRFSLAFPQGWFPDGAVLGVELPVGINQPREGAYRDTLTVIRFAADGATLDTVGRFPGIEMEQMTFSAGGRSVPAPSPVPLGRQTFAAVAGTRFFIATNESWEVQERSLDGAVTRLIRLETHPVAVTEQDIEIHRQEQLELMEGLPELRAVPQQIRTQITDRVRQARYPATLPFIAGLNAGADGVLWVQEIVKPGVKRQQFAVFDSSGVLLGRVSMPPRFQPTQFGAAELVGIWRDEDDVEHVRVYGLRRG